MLTNEELIVATARMLMNERNTIETTSGSMTVFDLVKILKKLVKDVTNVKD